MKFKSLKFSEGTFVQNGKEMNLENMAYIKFCAFERENQAEPKGLTNLGGSSMIDPTTMPLRSEVQGELEMNIRPAFPLLLVLFFSTFGYVSAQTNTVWSWCLSDSEQPVYVSRPFDSRNEKRAQFQRDFARPAVCRVSQRAV